MPLIDVCAGRPCDTCPFPPIAKTVCQAHKQVVDSLTALLASCDPAAKVDLEVELLACYSVTINHAVALGLASYDANALALLGDVAGVTATLLQKMAPLTAKALGRALAVRVSSLGPVETKPEKGPVH